MLEIYGKSHHRNAMNTELCEQLSVSRQPGIATIGGDLLDKLGDNRFSTDYWVKHLVKR